MLPLVDGTPGTPQPIAGNIQLYHLACPTTTTCVAIGKDFSGSQTTAVVVTITNGVAGPPRRREGRNGDR